MVRDAGDVEDGRMSNAECGIKIDEEDDRLE
jgi:hypothetical protein